MVTVFLQEHENFVDMDFLLSSNIVTQNIRFKEYWNTSHLSFWYDEKMFKFKNNSIFTQYYGAIRIIFAPYFHIFAENFLLTGVSTLTWSSSSGVGGNRAMRTRTRFSRDTAMEVVGPVARFRFKSSAISQSSSGQMSWLPENGDTVTVLACTTGTLSE